MGFMFVPFIAAAAKGAAIGAAVGGLGSAAMGGDVKKGMMMGAGAGAGLGALGSIGSGAAFTGAGGSPMVPAGTLGRVGTMANNFNQFSL